MAAASVATGIGASPMVHLQDWSSDALLVHNLFPNYGRRWVRKYRKPLIAFMHNYRIFCAAGTFERAGAPCRKCLDHRSSLPAVRHACYRESRVATLPLAVGTRFEKDPVLLRADRVVALTEEMAETFVLAGVPSKKVMVVPNFVPSATSCESGRMLGGQVGGDGGLFVGRLERNKGLDRAIIDWPSEIPLVVVGTGSEEKRLRGLAGPSVTFMGAQSRNVVRSLMREAEFLVFPSRWREGLPTVYLEALEAGLPTLAWPGSVVSDLAAADGTGVVVKESVSASLSLIQTNSATFSSRCRAVFARKYSAASWVGAIEGAIRDVAAGGS